MTNLSKYRAERRDTLEHWQFIQREKVNAEKDNKMLVIGIAAAIVCVLSAVGAVAWFVSLIYF